MIESGHSSESVASLTVPTPPEGHRRDHTGAHSATPGLVVPFGEHDPMTRHTIACPKCNAALHVDDEHVGKQGRCRACGTSFVIPQPCDPSPNDVRVPKPRRLPATERQKAFARDLGIQFDESIDRNSLSKLIAAAQERENTERFEQLERLGDRESEAYRQIREEILLEVDKDDPRLSKATSVEIMNALGKQGIGAILVTFKGEDARDLASGLKGVNIGVNISWTDDWLTEGDMREVLKIIGIKFAGIAAQVNGITNEIKEMNRMLHKSQGGSSEDE